MFLKSDFNICNNNNAFDLQETFTIHIFAAALTKSDNTKNLFKMLKSMDECKEHLTVQITPICESAGSGQGGVTSVHQRI